MICFNASGNSFWKFQVEPYCGDIPWVALPTLITLQTGSITSTPNTAGSSGQQNPTPTYSVSQIPGFSSETAPSSIRGLDLLVDSSAKGSPNVALGAALGAAFG